MKVCENPTCSRKFKPGPRKQTTQRFCSRKCRNRLSVRRWRSRNRAHMQAYDLQYQATYRERHRERRREQSRNSARRLRLGEANTHGGICVANNDVCEFAATKHRHCECMMPMPIDRRQCEQCEKEGVTI